MSVQMPSMINVNSGIECGNCGGIFVDEEMFCNHSCWYSYMSKRVKNERGSECYSCGDLFTDSNTVEHHTSYYPEETVTVCKSCHWKIHYSDGFRTDLEPSITREKWEREKTQCVRCGSKMNGKHNKTCPNCGCKETVYEKKEENISGSDGSGGDQQ